MDRFHIGEEHQESLIRYIRDFAENLERGEIHVTEVSLGIHDPIGLGVPHNGIRNEVTIQWVRRKA